MAERKSFFDASDDEEPVRKDVNWEVDEEWEISTIRGFSFDDDDPFENLDKYRAVTSGISDLKVESKPTLVVSDKVRAASAAYAAQLDRAERGTLSEAVGIVDESIPVTNDVQTLRIELLRAKRNLEKIQEARYIPLHPKETVKNIFLGNRYSLEFYRSFSDKKDLLQEAIAIGDGNVVLTVSF